MCQAIEPLLAAVVLGVASAAVNKEVDGHCKSCPACAADLTGAAETDALLQTPLIALPGSHVRQEVLAKITSDLTPVASTRVIAAIVGAAALAIVALLATAARTPLASGIPLLVCGAAWTAAIGLASFLATQGTSSYRWPRAALYGIAAIVAMSLICPPPALIKAGRGLAWFSADGMAFELIVGLAFGMIPIAIALLVARGASASPRAMVAIGAVLLGAELPPIFAQCCNVPAVNVWPVLAGTLVGASLLASAAFFYSRLRGDQFGSLYV